VLSEDRLARWTFEDGAPAGTAYQVVIDGQRIATVRSQGEDVIELK